jgi:endonuclease/exonuclease/phosphatase family metal-dependent hydrolase
MMYLRHKETNLRLRLFDLHLDHISEEAKTLGMSAALDFVDSYNAKEALPTVILGDFNAFPDSDVIKMLSARDDLVDVTCDVSVTYHGFGNDATKIDYIFLSPSLAEKVTAIDVWRDEKEGVYLSDHYPVCATLEY